MERSKRANRIGKGYQRSMLRWAPGELSIHWRMASLVRYFRYYYLTVEPGLTFHGSRWGWVSDEGVGAIHRMHKGLPCHLFSLHRVPNSLYEQSYKTIGLLGCETDSYDSEGAVTRLAPWRHVSQALLANNLEQFRGPVLQTPPMCVRAIDLLSSRSAVP